MAMRYKEIHVNKALNKITKEDIYFQGNYTLDPYQNCEFGCRYCDSYDDTIYIKNNIETLLKKEITTISNENRIIIGSVHDPYQNTEKQYKKTKNILKIIKKNNLSCHILTKSDLILRDLELISKIDDILVTISIISLKKDIQNIFENNLPITIKRLKTVKKMSKKGIKTGIAVIPILPYIVEDEIENLISSAKENIAEYILHKPLELKGDQKITFLNLIEQYFPDLISKYQRLYKDRYTPPSDYSKEIDYRFNKFCRKYKIKKNI
ncbi:MAG: radical SAM protein [Candidatus Thermoplasmatota archaeon]